VFNKSLEYLDRAEKVIPLATQTFSKGPNYFPKGAAPVYLRSGIGSHVWDVDDNEYIDFVLGLGPITLGYCYPAVDKAIYDQLTYSGITFSLPHPLEVELSELLVEIIPCAEMVRFTKTGSEACQAAVRAARAYTGREMILHWGYHGWHDWYSITTERPKGIPKAYYNYIREFKYNDISTVELLLNRFQEYKMPIAAVIMEPMIVEPPENGFLQQVKELAHQNGALLIFDETVTGFRWALGGAQEYFGVIPALSTFGKGIANGMPLAGVVGRADIMREFEDIFVSGTFGGECLSLTAGLATIKEMRNKNTIAHCWEMGTKLMSGLQFSLQVGGYPCRPAIVQEFTPEEKTLFIQEVIKRGILMHSGGLINLCYSHSEEDIAKMVDACKVAKTIVDLAKAEGRVNEMLEGEVIRPSFRRL